MKTEQSRGAFQARFSAVTQRVDKAFGWILVGQWVVLSAIALIAGPKTWAGESSGVNMHVVAAIVLGGLVALPAAVIAWRFGGTTMSRFCVAAAQMLLGSLLIHISGGHVESHFHVFVSLGILSAYRDWRVLLVATAIAGVDHVARGIF